MKPAYTRFVWLIFSVLERMFYVCKYEENKQVEFILMSTMKCVFLRLLAAQLTKLWMDTDQMFRRNGIKKIVL